MLGHRRKEITRPERNSFRSLPTFDFDKCPAESCRINLVPGRPTPTVSWFINDRLVEGHLEDLGRNVIVNRLEVSGVKREHLNSSYKCQASNTKLMMPVEKTVRLELLCKFWPCFIRNNVGHKAGF